MPYEVYQLLDLVVHKLEGKQHTAWYARLHDLVLAPFYSRMFACFTFFFFVVLLD